MRMLAAKIDSDYIDYVCKACDEGLLNCKNCPYRFSDVIDSSSQRAECICDLKNIDLDCFDSIAELLDFYQQVAKQWVGVEKC